MRTLKETSLRASGRSAVIQKSLDCFVVLLLTMTVSIGANANESNLDICGLVNNTKILSAPSNVAYQAGVDAYGNAVVPADGHTDLTSQADVIKVPLNVDLARRISGLNVAGLELNAPFGMVEIRSDGKIQYDGNDLTREVKTLCGISHKEVTTQVVDMPKEANILPLQMPAEVPSKTPAKAPVKPLIETPMTAKPAVKEMPPPLPVPLEKRSKTSLELPVRIEAGMVSEGAKVKPLIAIPPQGTIRNTTSETINGGAYKDFNYNE